MTTVTDPPVGVPHAPPVGGGGGGGGTVDISAGSISDLADAIAADIAGEALTVNATVSNEVEVKNDAGSAVPVTVGNFPAGFAVVGAVEIANDVGNPLPVSGTVAISGTVPVSLAAAVEIANDVGNPVPVSGTVTITDGAGSVTVDGTVAVSGTVAVTDNAGSLTVDAPVATPVFVRLSDGAAPIATLPTSLAALPALVAGAAVVGKVGIDQTTPGTTNLVALAANQSVNQAQVAGTAVDTNSGNKSAGTQRFVIATDQPNLTTPLNINNALVNGVTPLMGNGPTGTGALRVSIANDSTGIVALASGATVTVNTIGVAAGSLGKAEDAVAASGDSGVFILGINSATPVLPNAVGDYSGIPVSTNNGVFVAPTPIQVEITQTPVVSNAAIYAAGDQVGGVLTFAGAALASGRAGQIVGARLLDKDKQKANITLDIYALSPTLVNGDNGVYDSTDASQVTAVYIGTIDFLTANYRDTNSNSRCVGSVNGGAPVLPFNSSGSSSLFGVLATSGTPTFTSTSALVVYLSCIQF